MTRKIRALIAASSLAAIAVWIRHNSTSRAATRRDEPDQFADLYDDATSNVVIDDDMAADIIRKAQPALERARQHI